MTIIGINYNLKIRAQIKKTIMADNNCNANYWGSLECVKIKQDNKCPHTCDHEKKAHSSDGKEKVGNCTNNYQTNWNDTFSD